MPARKPEDLNPLFAQSLNAGDLDALMALYEPDATLMPSPGKTVTGTAAIRDALGGFLAMKPRMTLTSKILALAGDLALGTASWELKGTGSDGAPVSLKGQSVEVLRRQGDGRWLVVIDNPWGTG
jgi:uncharacterized protein (TIGR02246 family)